MEKIFNPSIRHRGVLCLSNNDGAIVAMDALAKAKVGDLKFKPYFQVRELIEKAGIAVQSSNYELYGSLSSKFHSILSEYANDIHLYSIDEVFLKIDDTLCSNFEALGREIRARIWNDLRLPVCVGAGSSPTLAKASNNFAKKNKSAKGVYVITDLNRKVTLEAMPVSKVWGIGKRLSSKLSIMGINNAWELSLQPPKQMRKWFSVNMERTVRELTGEPCLNLDDVIAPKKQIFSTRSFGQPVTTQGELIQSLVEHGQKVAKKAREQGSYIVAMIMFAHSSPFKGDYIKRQVVHHFNVPTNDERDIASAVSSAINALFVKGVSFSKSGLGAIELCNANGFQFDLFEGPTRDSRVMSVIDDLNLRFGKATIGVCSQSIQTKAKMRRDLMSPRYTTHWSDIPKIHCN